MMKVGDKVELSVAGRKAFHQSIFLHHCKGTIVKVIGPTLMVVFTWSDGACQKLIHRKFLRLPRYAPNTNLS